MTNCKFEILLLAVQCLVSKDILNSVCNFSCSLVDGRMKSDRLIARSLIKYICVLLLRMSEIKKEAIYSQGRFWLSLLTLS